MQNRHLPVTPDSAPQLAQRFALAWFIRHGDSRLLFHNYQRSAELVTLVERLAVAEQLTDAHQRAVVVAAWLVFTGYAIDYPEGINASEQALEALEKEASMRLPLVHQCLRQQRYPEINAPAAVRVFADALQALYCANGEFKTRSAWRLAEYELMTNASVPPHVWRQQLWQELMEVRWYTASGHQLFADEVAHRIQVLKSRIARDKYEPPVQAHADQLFQGIERNVPNSAVQTYLRSAYRTQINLSAIADNKAHIMISVNAILISIIISVLSYRNITETNPMVLMPAVIFLVTGLVSLTFAILSARPKVTRLAEKSVSPDELKRHLIFFGNFASLEECEFERMMDSVLRHGELLYGNMVRDLYHLGRVLDQKYRYLSISYNVFMVGFILTVLTFLIAFFA